MRLLKPQFVLLQPFGWLPPQQLSALSLQLRVFLVLLALVSQQRAVVIRSLTALIPPLLSFVPVRLAKAPIIE